MPIYEYACNACRHRFEAWQKMSDKPVRTCPECRAKKVERLISATSFHLKGGGWYSDLYAGPKPGSAKEGGRDSQEKGDSQEKKGDGKSDGASTDVKGKDGPAAGTAAKETSKKPPKKTSKTQAA